MRDPRLEKLADVLVNYSVGVKKDQVVHVSGPPLAQPLVAEVYRKVVAAGGHPLVRMSPEELGEIFLKHASEEQLKYVSPITLFEYERIDCSIGIWGEENTKALTNVDPKRIGLQQAARKPLLETFMKRAAEGKLHWCGTQFPSQASAQDAEMSLAEYEDFVFGAGLLDRDDPAAAWREVGVELARVAAFLGAHDEIRIEAPGTDLTYRVGGRTWIAAAGTNNFPDGEVFTGPVEGSANGTVRFTYPAIYAGNEVEDVRLAFRDGRVVEASAARGQAFLEAMLDQDPGARFLGEAAFGMNYGIGRFTRNILFDEKIGGTMHLALGQSYPETGGMNESGLHWDMICDLRQGRVYADGEPCYAEGKFTI